MNLKKKYSRRELLEKSFRYTGAAMLAGLTGYVALKGLFAGKLCREYDRCSACNDISNCSLVTKKEIKSKWAVKESRNGRK